MKRWPKKIVAWNIGRNLYLSVPFTWLLPEAAIMAENHKGPVFAGGPAVDLMPSFLSKVSEIGTECPVSALAVHNPFATFTSRGCINSCPFCAVPKIEGDLVELERWPVRPIVCDNNFLACSQRHFDYAVDLLKKMPFVDFNQGLDARLFKPHHARRLAELKKVKIRFALDHSNLASKIKDAVDLARNHGLKDIGIYVLIGFNDDPEDARHRLELVRSWKIMPNPMRFQPLDTLKKNDFVGENWTQDQLLKFMKYFSRLVWLGKIPFDEFRMEVNADA